MSAAPTTTVDVVLPATAWEGVDANVQALVDAWLAAEGSVVEAGQPLAVVEAMKMENILRAEKSATVKRVAAKAGESLAVDAVILEFE